LLTFFATGGNDSGGKFTAYVINTGGKFATTVFLTSVTNVLMIWRFAAGVVDTIG
jgi:hypothetical protein